MAESIDARPRSGNRSLFDPIHRILTKSVAVLFARRAEKTDADESRNTAATPLPDLEALLANLPGMAYRCSNNPERQMHYVSPGCLALSGYRPDALQRGQPAWGRVIHPDDRGDAWSSLHYAVSHQEYYELRYRIQTGDGQHKWVWDTGRATGSSGKEPVLEGFISDVTPLRRIQHERMHAIVEYSPIGILMFDRELQVVRVNPAFTRMIGYVKDDVTGRSLETFVHQDDAGTLKQAAQENLVGAVDHYSIGARFVHRDGHIVHAALHVALAYDGAGKPEFCVANVEDLTSRLSMEAQLNEQQSELLRLDRMSSLREMTAGIAHEINQPLTAIATYAQAALRFMNPNDFKPEQLRKALDRLTEQSLRASAAVERIRALARQQGQGRSELNDCSELVRSALELIRNDARALDIKFQVDLANNLPPVLCDAVRIQQVVLNLVRNAADSMARAKFAGGRAIEVKTEETGAGEVQITITDSGQGVDEAIGDRLFQPFSTDKAYGLGMGLSTSKSIVTACGGRIGFRNNPSVGASFTVTLPGIPGGLRGQ